MSQFETAMEAALQQLGMEIETAQATLVAQIETLRTQGADQARAWTERMAQLEATKPQAGHAQSALRRTKPRERKPDQQESKLRPQSRGSSRLVPTCEANRFPPAFAVHFRFFSWSFLFRQGTLLI